jgi:ribonuclease HI
MMWQETKHGLYKQYKCKDFNKAWTFMRLVAQLAKEQQYYPRWENEACVVRIWLRTVDKKNEVSDKDRSMAERIDIIYKHQDTAPHRSNDTNSHTLTVFADGGSRGNPGPSASGFIVLDRDDTVLIDNGTYIGISTNNQAEYTALQLALEECARLDAREVFVYMDSALVIGQMNGDFKISNGALKPIYDRIKEIAEGFNQIFYQHVPREFNKQAARAVNRSLDQEVATNTL